jgi:hypothetical protein
MRKNNWPRWRRCAAISCFGRVPRQYTPGRPTIGLRHCNLIEDLETQEWSSPEFLSQLLPYGLTPKPIAGLHGLASHLVTLQGNLRGKLHTPLVLLDLARYSANKIPIGYAKNFDVVCAAWGEPLFAYLANRSQP